MKLRKMQSEIRAWVMECFGYSQGMNKIIRNHRFLEEAVELVQAAKCTREEAHAIVDYVFSRPVGEIKQEVGGVLTTLGALCNAHYIEMDEAVEREIASAWSRIESIRIKSAGKPTFGVSLRDPDVDE